MSKLNQEDVVPLYKQLKEILKNSILNGEIKPNEKIPSENVLMEKYGVSRITVRNAIAELVDEGLLVTKQGKGTFASKTKLERDIAESLSFSLSCKINGVTPGSKILKKELIEPTERDILELNSKLEDKVVYIQRLLFANDEPVIIEDNYFVEKYDYLIGEELENKSLYEILQNKYHVDLAKSKKTIEICTASDRDSLLLRVSKGSPLLLMREIVTDRNNVPIHRTKNLIVGDKFKYIIYSERFH